VERIEALLAALDLQVEVGEQLRPSHLAHDSRCAGWSIRDVLGHSIGVTVKLADFAAGTTDEPRTPEGDLVGPDHRLALERAAEAAGISWASADRARCCTLPFGTFTTDGVVALNLVDVLAHTWDVAEPEAISLDGADQLWAWGLDAAELVIGPERDLGYYAPARAPDAAASPQERFLAYLGRTSSVSR
jgi:uncharacterized protein (TIGR03086 family)